MKKSVNFNGFQAKHRRITAQDFVDLCRRTGWTDEEIKALIEQAQAKREAKEQKTPSE